VVKLDFNNAFNSLLCPDMLRPAAANRLSEIILFILFFCPHNISPQVTVDRIGHILFMSNTISSFLLSLDSNLNLSYLDDATLATVAKDVSKVIMNVRACRRYNI